MVNGQKLPVGLQWPWREQLRPIVASVGLLLVVFGFGVQNWMRGDRYLYLWAAGIAFGAWWPVVLVSRRQAFRWAVLVASVIGALMTISFLSWWPAIALAPVLAAAVFPAPPKGVPGQPSAPISAKVLWAGLGVAALMAIAWVVALPTDGEDLTLCLKPGHTDDGVGRVLADMNPQSTAYGEGLYMPPGVAMVGTDGPDQVVVSFSPSARDGEVRSFVRQARALDIVVDVLAGHDGRC